MTEQIKITKIRKKPGGRDLTISGLEFPLRVSEETIYAHRLIEGIVITVSQLALLQAESERYLCRYEASRMLAMREHSVGQLRTKLNRKKFDSKLINEVIDGYIETDVLNDHRLATRWSELLVERKPCGKSYLVAFLHRKLISRDLARAVAENILNAQPGCDRAVAALKTKWSRLSQLELERARTRAYNYLSRRGFSYGEAKAAFEQLANND